MITGTVQKIRVVHEGGIQTIHEGPLAWKPETIHSHGTLVATKSADGIWRHYSNKSDTPSWPVVGLAEAAAFAAIPEHKVTT